MNIAKLYYQYKRNSDDQIRKYLQKFTIVKRGYNGKNSVFGYYKLSNESMKLIMGRPRGNSLTFDAGNVDGEPIQNLVEYKEITHLVKNNSKFFLKPDVGEIFDQIEFDDLTNSSVTHILFKEDAYQLLDGTQGEHYLMDAVLLKTINK